MTEPADWKLRATFLRNHAQRLNHRAAEMVAEAQSMCEIAASCDDEAERIEAWRGTQTR